MSRTISVFSPLNFIVNTLSGKPIRSICPLAITVSAGISNSWNFNDEDPALIANVLAIIHAP